MKQVLIVDDDDLVRSTVSALLETLDFQVSEVANGKSALRQISDITFDLIVTDLFMPEFDGIELILKIREIPVLTPIVLMTGGGRFFPRGSDNLNDLTESAEFFGASYVIHKPFRKADFAKVVHKAVQN